MNAKFNLNDYETVKSRKQKFYSVFKDGRIIVEAKEITKDTAVFEAVLFRNPDEQMKGCALATGYAQEFKGQNGFANKFSWCENCEESAIGRALDNAGFCGNGKCSREEMKHVEAHEESTPVPQGRERYVSMIKEHLMKISNSGKDVDAIKRFYGKVGVTGKEELFALCDDKLMDIIAENIVGF